MRFNKIINFTDLLLENFKSLTDVIFHTNFFNKINVRIKHKEVIVIGNGSSLQDHINNDNYDLNNSSKMVLNFFPLTDWFIFLKPDNYTMVDLGAINYHSHNSLSIINKVNDLLLIFDKVDWPLNIFLSKFHNNSDFVNSIKKTRKCI